MGYRERMSSHWTYRLYGQDRRLLYIGYSSDPGVRLRSHSITKPWWSEVESVEIQRHASRGEALDAERLAILKDEPPRNMARHQTVGGPTPLHSFRVADDLYLAAKAQARAEGTTLAAVLNQALVEYIEDE